MPPSLFSPYTPRVGTQILLTDLHYPGNGGFLFLKAGERSRPGFARPAGCGK